MTYLDPITPLDPAQTEAQEQETDGEHYVRRVLVAFDIFCNVTFFYGFEDETISTHSARAALDGKLWGIILSRFLCFFQGDHGACAMAGDLERARRIIATEDKTGMLE